MNALQSGVARTLRAIGRLEDAALATLLGAMIVLACLQILLRNVADTGLLWIGPLLRYMVLWLGLLGALCAARRGEHIAIDALARVLSPRLRRAAAILSSGFTAAICGLVAYHAARLVGMDREAGSLAFGDVPAWWLQSVIPLCFGGMALRYVLRGVQDALAHEESPTGP